MAEKRKVQDKKGKQDGDAQDKKPKDTSVTVALIGAGATIIAALIGVLSLWVQSQKSVPMSPTSTLLSTTNVSSCIENDFSDENKTKLNWSIASNSDSDGTETTLLNNGKYIWSMNASTPILYTKQLILSQGVITQNRNYELEVEIQKLTGSDSVEYGVMLNQEDQLKHYTILITPYKQELWVGKRTPDKWTTLRPSTTFSFINQNGVNKLKVVLQGINYQIYINGNLAGEFTDDEYQSGTIELVAEISEINSDVTLEIDNFRLCNIP